MNGELKSSENYDRITFEIPKKCKCISITYVKDESDKQFMVKNKLLSSQDIEECFNGAICTLT